MESLRKKDMEKMYFFLQKKENIYRNVLSTLKIWKKIIEGKIQDNKSHIKYFKN